MATKYRSEKQFVSQWLHKARNVDEAYFMRKSGEYRDFRFTGMVLYWRNLKRCVGRVVHWHTHGLGDEIVLMVNDHEAPSFVHRACKYLKEERGELVVRVPHSILHGDLKKDILPHMIQHHQQLLDKAINAEPSDFEAPDDTYHYILQANKLAREIERYSVGVVEDDIHYPCIPTNTAPDKIGYMIAKAAASRMRVDNDTV